MVQYFAACVGDQYQIFHADAEAAFQINARFNGKDHALLGDEGGGGADFSFFVLFQADEMAQTVGEEGTIAAVFYVLSGGPVQLRQGNAGAYQGFRQFAGFPYQTVHLSSSSVGRPVKKVRVMSEQ